MPRQPAAWHPAATLWLLLGLSFVASGCGQKGALTLPAASSAPAASAAASR